MELNQRVYIYRPSGLHGRSVWMPGVVTKITSTGLFDVSCCDGTVTKRFDKQGCERGVDYLGYRLDDEMTYEARFKWVTKLWKIEGAQNILNSIAASRGGFLPVYGLKTDAKEIILILNKVEKATRQAREILNSIEE